eukprot:gnl/Spiro4/26819_TR13329_c0_g1_i1.p1 gnl/Spiro4/26819_TR13329_c0_g1~~gnl/Spiro4/26819_TR13329_c0_g1_i1.p1  ORF type:complete len:507 (+),score=73.80 gnl/Spiro4/26819_TR13329_c0_g1_i1:65-1585(+)
MSQRGVWIVDSTGRIICSRRYPVVERRVCTRYQDRYSPIPADDAEMSKIFLAELISDQQRSLYPVTSLCGGRIWPVAVLRHNRLLFVAIPAVEDDVGRLATANALVDLPAVSATYTFLEAFCELAQSCSPAGKFTLSEVAELKSLLAAVNPFGTPLDTDVKNLRSVYKNNNVFLSTQSQQNSIHPSQKRSMWRPLLFAGKQTLEFTIREEIRAALYDRPTSPDTFFVSGSIVARTELEGMTDVIVPLHPTSRVQNMTVHPCVTNPEICRTWSAGRREELMFKAILGAYPLLKFGVVDLPPSELPLQGLYRMREVQDEARPTLNHVRILALQLRVVEHEYCHAFEQCEVQLPFPNRGRMSGMEVSTGGVGTVSMSPNRRSLIWNIGKKFNERTEANLSGMVFFDPATEDDTRHDDPFLSGQNSCAHIFFRLTRASLTGMEINGQSVRLNPQPKNPVVCNVMREIVATDYLLWNTFGAAVSVARPEVLESVEELTRLPPPPSRPADPF